MINIISLIISAGGTALSAIAWFSDDMMSELPRIPLYLALIGWIIALAIAIALSLTNKRSELEIQSQKNEVGVKAMEITHLKGEIDKLSHQIDMSKSQITTLQGKNEELTHSVNTLTKVLSVRDQKEGDVKPIPRAGERHD